MRIGDSSMSSRWVFPGSAEMSNARDRVEPPNLCSMGVEYEPGNAQCKDGGWETFSGGLGKTVPSPGRPLLCVLNLPMLILLPRRVLPLLSSWSDSCWEGMGAAQDERFERPREPR